MWVNLFTLVVEMNRVANLIFLPVGVPQLRARDGAFLAFLARLVNDRFHIQLVQDEVNAMLRVRSL
ncbi:hypothetical protein [Paraburkholderia humisilvae]|uniref:hypothetical protein n=1 Tax=Paraburkholderia humisilvae TaxID=627669 RepID=UPI00158327B0